MKKNVWDTYQDQERINGKDISLSEIRTIHRSLVEQYEGIGRDIVDAIDRNDCVKLTLLITKRKQVQTAIEEIETMYEDDLCTSQMLRGRIVDGLRNSAQLSEKNGGDVLQSVRDSLEKLNHSAHSAASKTLTVSLKAISIGNQLQHKAGRFIVSQTSSGLLKIANVLKKNS
ncbi:hypothetical protein ACH0BF_09010 [Pseudobacillus sp. 179-B 2D1 NHS]|uniref:hypothetical protein n=1 Tax=Pseudobacillus sp. 179-B 2D1 NHS TaxID=3374292 RepID=UPI003879842D